MKTKNGCQPCKNCEHCDVEKKKCFPESLDCHSEYDLTDEDIYTATDERCDFFKRKKSQESEDK